MGDFILIGDDSVILSTKLKVSMYESPSSLSLRKRFSLEFCRVVYFWKPSNVFEIDCWSTIFLFSDDEAEVSNSYLI
jgi:hypothetical protein